MRPPPFIRPLARRVRLAGRWVRHGLHLYQSDDQLAADAQQYWTGRPGEQGKVGDVPPQNFHWRGSGMFQDDAVWLAVGRQHFELYEAFAKMVDFPRPAKRVLEWGCGGGANAVHFARGADEFVGVDLSQAALDECVRQATKEGLANVTPVRVDVGDDAPVVRRFGGQVDLFLCTYVFEVLPSQAHGAKLLATARELLRPGGMAVVQIKYATGDLRTRSRRWGYARDFANMTTYRVDEFWQLAKTVGLTPRAVTLVPEQPMVHDERYAYFLLTK
jgi:SAM-dependent methyltransferase